jgi:small GTP-binding protein
MDKIKRRVMNIILLGDHRVGKTSIINSYLNFPFEEETLPTIGIDKQKDELTINTSSETRLFRVRFIDPSGQERFRSIANTYIRIADGIIMVYSVDDRRSFENIEKVWLKSIDEYVDYRDKALILVANKSDLYDKEEFGFVNFEEGENLSKKLKIPFFRCSAKNNLSIKDMILKITEMAAEKIIKKENDNSNPEKNVIILDKKEITGHKKKQKGCYYNPYKGLGNLGQAFANAMAKDLKEERRKRERENRKCLIQ